MNDEVSSAYDISKCTALEDIHVKQTGPAFHLAAKNGDVVRAEEIYSGVCQAAARKSRHHRIQGFGVESLAFEAFVENSSYCFFFALNPVLFANFMEGSFRSRVGELEMLTVNQLLRYSGTGRKNNWVAGFGFSMAHFLSYHLLVELQSGR